MWRMPGQHRALLKTHAHVHLAVFCIFFLVTLDDGTKSLNSSAVNIQAQINVDIKWSTACLNSLKH